MTIRVPITNTIQYVTLVSGVVRLTGETLTDMEIEVLSAFIDVQLENKMLYAGFAFSPQMKKEVAKRLNRKNFNTLNNYLKSLCDKKVLKRIEGGYEIIRFFIPDSKPLIIEYNVQSQDNL